MSKEIEGRADGRSRWHFRAVALTEPSQWVSLIGCWKSRRLIFLGASGTSAGAMNRWNGTWWSQGQARRQLRQFWLKSNGSLLGERSTIDLQKLLPVDTALAACDEVIE